MLLLNHFTTNVISLFLLIIDLPPYRQCLLNCVSSTVSQIFCQSTSLVLEKDFPQSVLFINLVIVYRSHWKTKFMLVVFL